MSLVMNLYYTGTNGSARAFAEEMETSGVAAAIRAEAGNERYEYFYPKNDPETVLLIDAWRDQSALDAHHASPMMGQIMALREKYDDGSGDLSRKKKKSFDWYKKVIASNGDDLA